MRRSVIVSDRMQRSYRYKLVAPIGRGFDPEFDPDLTPKEMLELGVFGGNYMTDCRGEFLEVGFCERNCRPIDRILHSTISE